MASDIVEQIRKVTHRRFTAEQMIKVVVEGLRCEISVAALCLVRDYHLTQWSQTFLEAGKNGLTKATRRDATGDEVKRSSKKMPS